MDNTSRFTKLLGECRRQMNGAVAGSMRYYGAEYGLNYGVSLSTIRSLAALEGKEHLFAIYLYQHHVREIRLAALNIAQPEMISQDDLDFWAQGIINSEVAEEAAFSLFQYVESALLWLSSENELLIYTALLSIAKSHKVELDFLAPHIYRIVNLESKILNSALITLLESYCRDEEHRDRVNSILHSLPATKTSEYIRSELAWRMDFL